MIARWINKPGMTAAGAATPWLAAFSHGCVLTRGERARTSSPFAHDPLAAPAGGR
jgi:hypothetical protein